MMDWARLREWFQWIQFPHDDEDVIEVIVRKDDTLSGIAKEITGDANRWKELVDANPDKQWDEHYTITPKEKLRIPHDWF